MGKLTTQLIPLESIIRRVLSMLPEDAATEARIEEWAYQAYELIATHDVYEQDVCFLEVNNNVADIPRAAFRIDMVMYRKFTDPPPRTLDVNVYDSKEPEHEVDARTLSYIEAYMKPNRMSSWRPLSYTSNSFHNTVLCNMSPNKFIRCNDTFSINPRTKCIITSFNKGYLAVAYAGLPKDDETDSYLIPDKEIVHQAIEQYCFMKFWQWQMNMREQGADKMYSLYATQWELMAAKAIGELMMPDFIEYQNLRNMNKFIKEDSPFSTALGALNSREWLSYGNDNSQRFARLNGLPNRLY